MTKPRITVETSTKGMDRYKGMEAVAYTMIRPATINTSPWAKFMSLSMP